MQLTPNLRLSAKEIASLCLHDPKNFKIQLQSTEHRIAIISDWIPLIPEGAKVLELGCGQGDTTAVLAALVGEAGKVTGVDPASLDYGTSLVRLTHPDLNTRQASHSRWANVKHIFPPGP